jgi:glutamine synthetase
VLLHASYPYTRQAGYLATVYHNVYLDFGEVFPILSKDGQKAVVKEMLELTPADKLLWSTDGHWFPETYALSNMQVREVLTEVLIKRVDRGLLTVKQATDLVKKVFFDNANRLYGLNLKPVSTGSISTMSPVPHGVRVLDDFLSKHPNILFFRLQWVDYVGMLRLRVVPVSTMRAMAADPDQSAIYVPTVGLCLLGDDTAASALASRGRNAIVPDWSTLRSCESYAPGHASLMCDLRPELGLPSICPRTVTRNATARAKKSLDLDILIGFEIEVVFLERDSKGMVVMQSVNAHSWSCSTALTPARTQLCDEIATAIMDSGIELLLYHAESGDNQFEFVTGPLPPLAAVDALYHTRQIIEHTAAQRGLRATLHPKPFPMQAGTAAHTHFSLANHREKQGAFLGGVLQHLPALCAFGLGAPCSYRRVGDSCWAGGTWVCWGDDNRETPLRRIHDEDAHWEIRCVDGTANMYLFIGALIEAGVLGIEECAQFPEPCLQNPANLEVREKYGVTRRLPLNFSDALKELEKEDKLADRIGRTVVEKFYGMGYDGAERHASMQEDYRFLWEVERY